MIEKRECPTRNFAKDEDDSSVVFARREKSFELIMRKQMAYTFNSGNSGERGLFQETGLDHCSEANHRGETKKSGETVVDREFFRKQWWIALTGYPPLFSEKQKLRKQCDNLVPP
ncbi:hypothetical protein B9Z55_002028 [Caenorhabditis nigoni]|uniref:Uncharacterized protein n=1 Tax=Caenorhabditis nigoni TaxID=1611254 RepID=A0A2G5VIR5_9PELO|nr:hypothetical protein B9Z55_002028 [Caenorhabditis nigoni]